MFKKILKHKIIIAIILILVLGAGYFGYRSLTREAQPLKYNTTLVSRGSLIVSVSGTGQASSANELDIKPRVSGDIVYVGLEKGKEVKSGTLFVQFDTRDVQKAVNDAETSLETVQLELDELLSPPDELSLLQAEGALDSAKQSKQKLIDTIQKDYDDGLNDIANTFLDLPNIMAGLNDILFGLSFSNTQQNIYYYADAAKLYDTKAGQYRTDVYDKYQVARKVYDKNLQDYKSASRFSENSVIESLLSETYQTNKSISEAIKNANNLIQFYKDKLIEHGLKTQSLADTHLSNLNSYTSKTNGFLVNVLSDITSLQNDKNSLIDADRTIREKELSLEKLKAGADELTIRAKRIAIQQKQDALLKEKENLADCSVYIPFDGILADVNVKKGDSVSSGTVLGSIITKQKIAEVSLNEIDAAQVKIGQKATISFDALPDLTVSGKVVDVDTTGVVSQGVVSYGVKIQLDTQEEAIKQGMSVSVDIITNAKQDVLSVVNSAVKSQGDSYYVEIVKTNQIGTGIDLSEAPQRQEVEIGLSNDLYTEIISGLKDGDIVVSSVSSNTTNSNQGQGQGFSIPGFSSGGGQRIFQVR